jgi:hypothetical protein
MYINPFFAGIVSTVMVELIAIICIALHMGNEK